MRLEQGLWQKQSLQLTMTQELQQAIAILQYTAHELTSFLEMKAMENPLIQLDTPIVESADPRDGRMKRNYINHSDHDRESWLEQMAEPTGGLADHLFSQLTMKALSVQQKELIEQFIYNLDANGYLTTSVEEVANELQAPVEEAEEVLHIIQSLEPYGVGARSLQECLLIQAKKMERTPTLVITLLEQHFTEFAERKWKLLADDLSTALKDIQKAADFITTLDPRPGSHFDHERPEYVIPDLILEIHNGKLQLRLFENHLPSIRYQYEYDTQMSSIADDQVKQYLNEKRQDYRWIMRSLEQRKQTLLKVGQEILVRQNDFFLKGPQHLKPLTMKEVAEETDVHESTVSRAIRGKYIQTPCGMYELKIFFSQALQTKRNVKEASAGQAKALIESMIQREDKSKPLSDQIIANQLKEEGLQLSRRTVAKYREQLRIPSSMKRRRYE